MKSANDQHDEAWLREQVSMMQDWLASVQADEPGDRRRVEAIARHRDWLEACLTHLTQRKAA
ncbi:MAG: hypothetical protein RIB03_00785 [Henriciella sp.]|uniref:hypothetical protein n=1 Tax=Henriciella sp. TaxID=1968823 RepID=UPI0032ED9B42